MHCLTGQGSWVFFDKIDDNAIWTSVQVCNNAMRHKQSVDAPKEKNIVATASISYLNSIKFLLAVLLGATFDHPNKRIQITEVNNHIQKNGNRFRTTKYLQVLSV